MAAPESDSYFHCGCARRPSITAGWEGSALLKHGYLVKFGCESFIFSIPDPFDGGEIN